MPSKEEETGSTEETSTGSSHDREIDLHVLAEKVYHLLQEEARLERERLGLRSAG